MGMTLHKSWHKKLEKELQKPYVQCLKDFLHAEKQAGIVIYPAESYIFNAFSNTPFDKVKVVIMGQDPYHGPGQAHGLSFSVPRGVSPPPSLKNIFQELVEDVGVVYPSHGCLESWANQGVLLLNATLTVQAHKPKSHYGKGWEEFTDAVVRVLMEREDPLLFVLWGSSAKEKCERILYTKKHPHIILSAAHPSPFSVSGFSGCRHFSKINFYLTKWNKDLINWSLEEKK